MSLITNYEELAVSVTPEPVVHPWTVVRRKRRLEAIAWFEFANGGRATTPRSAMARAMRHYLPEHGLWVTTCAVCGTGFTAKRSDAVCCTKTCAKRQQRARGRATK